VLVAAPDYLARRGAPACVDELAGHSCIRDTNLRGDGAWPLVEAGALRPVRVSGGFLVNSARVARDLACAGEGIALCPDYVVRADLAEGRLVRVLPGAEGPGYDIHAVHLRQRRLARRTRALIDFLVRDRSGGLAGQQMRGS
jgi:DNA-binding transcriptional LysR family regulator